MHENRPHPLVGPGTANAERRALARYPFDLEAVCRRAGGSLRDGQPARVCNISAHGLGLLLARRIEVGSDLALDLADTPQSRAGTLHVRVMNVREVDAGFWLHGCALVGAGETGLQEAILAKLGRPPGGERRGLLRYSFVVTASARPLTAALRDGWGTTTQDLSAGGVRIAGERRIEAGTLLSLKLQADKAAGARTLMARVMHAQATPTGWELGCKFPTRLSPDELFSLLKESWTRRRQNRGKPDPLATLKIALADQIEHNNLAEAHQTLGELLRLQPSDPDALAAREFLDALLNPLVPSVELHCFRGHTACVNAVAFCAGGRLALSGGGVDDEFSPHTDHSIRFWDLAAGFEVHSFSGHTSPVVGVAVPQRGNRALTGSRCGMLLLWDIERRAVIRQFEKHGRGTNCIAISAGGKWVLTGCDDALLRLWDADLGRCLRRFRGHEGGITAWPSLPDDRSAVSAGIDRTVRLWMLDSTQRQAVIGSHDKSVLCIAASADGRRAVSGSADNTVRLWDLASRSEMFRLEGHTNVVNAVAFSADGTLLASASADNTVRLWDAKRGVEVGSFAGHAGAVKSIAFSPDDRRLLSAGSDQSVRLWELT